MLLPALLTLAPTLWGTYVASVGQQGMGGIRETITLKPDGSYQYDGRGCFLDCKVSGRFQTGPELLLLQPPTSLERGGPRWEKARRFHSIIRKGKNFLIEEAQLPWFVESVGKGRSEGAGFFVKS